MNYFDHLVESYEMTCFACPTQYEGKLKDGRSFYFRYRFGWASLGFGDSVGEAVADSLLEDGGRGVQFGDSLDGTLTEEEFKNLFVRLADGGDDGSA